MPKRRPLLLSAMETLTMNWPLGNSSRRLAPDYFRGPAAEMLSWVCFAGVVAVLCGALFVGVYLPEEYNAGRLNPFNTPIIEAARQSGCELRQVRYTGGRPFGESDKVTIDRCTEILGEPLTPDPLRIKDKPGTRLPTIQQPYLIVARSDGDHATVKFQKDGAAHSSNSSFTVKVERAKNGVWHAVDESGDIDGIWMP